MTGFKRGNPYKKTSIETATKEELVLMLYEGAIRFTKLGQTFLEENKIPDASKNICRAQAIVVELMNSLNHQAGGDISKNLEYLYSVMVDNLTVANFDRNPKPLALNLQILEKLKTAWEGVLQQIKDGKVKIER